MVSIRVSGRSMGTSASNIRLIKLIQDRAATFIIDVAYLSHDLDISKKPINQPERSGSTYLLILVRADLGSRRALRAVAVVVPVLGCIRLVGRTVSIVEVGRILLIVGHASLFQCLSQVVDPVAITRVQAVSAELAQLTVRHLFGLLDLLRVQLNLCGVHSVRANMDVVLVVRRLHIRVVVVVLDWLGCNVLVASLPILLSYSTLELVDGTFLKLLAHEILLAEPRILGLTVLRNVHGATSDHVGVNRRLRIILR